MVQIFEDLRMTSNNCNFFFFAVRYKIKILLRNSGLVAEVPTLMPLLWEAWIELLAPGSGLVKP